MSSSSSSSSTVADREAYDVIIVGAGIAGLAAARHLHLQGLNIVVLEARDRIGGRLWTNKSVFTVPVDMGGSWIHGTAGGNPLTQLAKDHGIIIEKTDYDNSIVYDERGNELSDSIEEKYEATYERLFKSITQIGRDRLRTNHSDISVGEALKDCRSRLNISASESKYLDMAIKSEIEHEYASSADNMSLRMFDTDTEYPGPDAVFPRGYNQITDVLAAEINTPQPGNHSAQCNSGSSCGSKILLECAVHRVEYMSGSKLSNTRSYVQIYSSKGVFRASKVVITLPLGVLQANSVQFEPPLPQSKLTVIQKMHMGAACKVFLEFPTVFWPRNHVFHLISSNSDRHLDVFNLHTYNKGAGKILMVYYGGPQAYLSESMTEEALVEEIMSSFRAVWGKNKVIPNPIKYLKTHWGTDPYALGAYSYAGVGITPEDYKELGATVGDCVYFAGEATSRDYISSATGAFLTGEIAAKRILVDLKK